MFCHSLLAWRVSIERSAVILMGIPLCVICCFSLAAFNICSLCLIFVNLINMCLGVFLLGFILFGGFSRVTAGFSSYDGEFRMPLVLAQASPIFHSSCEGKLGMIRGGPGGIHRDCPQQVPGQ